MTTPQLRLPEFARRLIVRFPETPPGKAKLQGGLSESAGKFAVTEAGQIAVGYKAVAAFQPQVQPAEDVDLDTRRGLDHEYPVLQVIIEQAHFPAAGVDVNHRVNSPEILNAVAQAEYPPIHIEALACGIVPQDIVVEVIAPESDGQRLAKFQPKMPPMYVLIGIAEAGELVF